MIALPSVSVARAAERAELIRRKLMSKRLRVSRDDVLEVTASIGVAFASADRPTIGARVDLDGRSAALRRQGERPQPSGLRANLDEISSEQFATVEEDAASANDARGRPRARRPLARFWFLRRD